MKVGITKSTLPVKNEKKNSCTKSIPEDKNPQKAPSAVVSNVASATSEKQAEASYIFRSIPVQHSGGAFSIQMR